MSMTHFYQRIHRTLHTISTYKLIGDQGNYTHYTKRNGNMRLGQKYVLLYRLLLEVYGFWYRLQNNRIQKLNIIIKFFTWIQIAELSIMKINIIAIFFNDYLLKDYFYTRYRL